jgi:SAM-dependent methyltransferase
LTGADAAPAAQPFPAARDLIPTRSRRRVWNPITTRVTQFDYFDRLLDRPAWKGRRVLDFGGNVGGFLVGAGDNVDHEDYVCLDINRTVIEQGRLAHPRARFVHFDRYSSQYNPAGVRNLPVPDCGSVFDVILAFSVFTHIDWSEMAELVGQLRAMLAPRGVLAFTFCDPSYDRSLSNPTLPSSTDVWKNLVLQKAHSPGLSDAAIDEMVERASRSRWCVLIDDKLYVEPGIELCHQRRAGRAHESYCSYFTVDFVASLFPDGKVLPPASPEWQHCCILGRD